MFENTMASKETGNYIIADGQHDNRLSALRQLAGTDRLRQVTCEVGFGYFGPDGTLRKFLFSELRGTEELALTNFARVTTG